MLKYPVGGCRVLHSIKTISYFPSFIWSFSLSPLQLKELGSILDGIKPQQMDTLISFLKEKLLGPSASHFARLLLLEVIELRASGWKLTDTQRQYYSEVFC